MNGEPSTSYLSYRQTNAILSIGMLLIITLLSLPGGGSADNPSYYYPTADQPAFDNKAEHSEDLEADISVCLSSLIPFPYYQQNDSRPSPFAALQRYYWSQGPPDPPGYSRS